MYWPGVMAGHEIESVVELMVFFETQNGRAIVNADENM